MARGVGCGAISAFIASHPEADFRPRLTLREVLRASVQSPKQSQIFGSRRDSAELLASYSPDS